MQRIEAHSFCTTPGAQQRFQSERGGDWLERVRFREFPASADEWWEVMGGDWTEAARTSGLHSA